MFPPPGAPSPRGPKKFQPNLGFRLAEIVNRARASSVPVLALECTVQSWAEVVTVTRETNRLPTGLLDVGASVTSNCCVVDDTDVFFMAAIRLWDEGREPFIWTSDFALASICMMHLAIDRNKSLLLYLSERTPHDASYTSPVIGAVAPASRKPGAFMHLPSYVMFYYNYLIYAILKIIRAKYKDLNKALKKGVISSKQIETSLFNLKEIVDTFNKIFGWPLLFIIFTSSIIFLDYTDEFFNGKIFALEGRKFGMALGSYVSMALLTSYGAIVVILLCDYIGEEMTKVEERLFKLKRASSEKEISSILVNVRYTFPKFSAAGFFVIGKSTILTVLGTVVTFLVIMVQFKENK
ncbi:gustatory receptor 68 [Tribolium castaneum]|uniref:Gustatory receptor n=1 Tax=Tribolium castaneum TaxID=7070 RepID=D2A645_TRICA|nr:gustatory receptor 68 [Tribolium castaneum]